MKNIKIGRWYDYAFVGANHEWKHVYNLVLPNRVIQLDTDNKIKIHKRHNVVWAFGELKFKNFTPPNLKTSHRRFIIRKIFYDPYKK